MNDSQEQAKAPDAAPLNTTQEAIPIESAQELANDEKSTLIITHVIYGLMAWGVWGMFDQNIVPNIYVFNSITLPFIVGGILIYVKKGEISPFWYARHYRWLMYTFWFSILWQVLYFSVNLMGISLSTATIGAIWSIYRVARGWIALQQRKNV